MCSCCGFQGSSSTLVAAYDRFVKDFWGLGEQEYLRLCPVELEEVFCARAPQFLGRTPAGLSASANTIPNCGASDVLQALLQFLHQDLAQATTSRHPDSDIGSLSRLRPDDLMAALTRRMSWDDHHVEHGISVISDLFRGQVQVQSTCSVCSHESTALDPVFFISVPVPKNPVAHCSRGLVVSRLRLRVPYCDMIVSEPEWFGLGLKINKGRSSFRVQ